MFKFFDYFGGIWLFMFVFFFCFDIVFGNMRDLFEFWIYVFVDVFERKCVF